MPETAAGPVTDVLGAPFTAETITLAPDDEGEVVATLIRRPSSSATQRVVLHVHGFADYFFQTDYAHWWAERGHAFAALDLRKYGRSLRPHQTATYVDDLHTYFEELDEAWERVVGRDGHTRVVLSGHSTGGLVVALWAHHRRERIPELEALVLNSPWFDLQGAGWLRTLPARAALDQIGVRQPRRPIPRKVTGLYGRSLHRDHDGEWDFDLAWKPLESFPVLAGWLRAVRLGHAELHRGLAVPAPVLVLSSLRSALPTEMGEEVHSADIVLDVEQIRRWASSVGPHVTSVGIDGARHDVVLSRPPVRERVYAEIERWLATYVDPGAPPA